VNERVHLISLGCPKNQVDSEVTLANLCSEGFRPVAQPQEAGIIVITTCCFINDAKQESIDIILEHARLKEDGCKMLVVCGCLVQRYGKRLVRLLPEVDLFVGLPQMRSLGRILRQYIETSPESRERILSLENLGPAWDAPAPRLLSTPRHYAYIKIADGCSHRCTFCIIPKIRGPYRSRPMADILSEAHALVQEGVKELILVAQDAGGYGTEGEKKNILPDLIKKLAKIIDLEWIRILYLHPSHVNPELLSVIREEPKCCSYLDIPIQHVVPEILRRMGRGEEDVREKLWAIRTLAPNVHIRTSLIVGFPGESEDEFSELLKFVEEFRFDSLGVFTYSREEGTPAAIMKHQIHPGTKERRKRLLMEAQAHIVDEINQNRIGQVFDVMIDGFDPKAPANLIGRTFFQAPEIDGLVFISGGAPFHIGSRVKAEITGNNFYDLIGQVSPSFCHVKKSKQWGFPEKGHPSVLPRGFRFS
jgi:ribosomal protein S12 methylthiotransferase